jgi:hypothetical protein
LPPGYRLRLDPDLPVLCRPDGSEVAAFSARGTSAERVEAVAWEDARAKFTQEAHSPVQRARIAGEVAHRGLL